MAIGWWFDTGIYSKMARDVGYLRNWTTEWTLPSTHELESLKISHVLPLTFIFGAMIILSMFVFWFEVLSQGGKRMKESRARARVLSQRGPDAGYAQRVHRINVATVTPIIV